MSDFFIISAALLLWAYNTQSRFSAFRPASYPLVASLAELVLVMHLAYVI